MEQKQTVSLSAHQYAALAAAASELGCAPESVLSSAVDAYLDLYAWQVAQIRQGLQEAEAGQFVPAAEVDAFFARALHAD